MRAGSQYPGSVNACSRPCFRRGYTHSGFCAPTKRVDFWCSAAVTAAVVSFRTGVVHRPCEVAGRVFPAVPCCADLEPCDQTHELDQVLDLFSMLRGPRVPGTLTPAQISDARMPVGWTALPQLCIKWRSGLLCAAVHPGEPCQAGVVELPGGQLKESRPLSEWSWLELFAISSDGQDVALWLVGRKRLSRSNAFLPCIAALVCWR
jgi:hypothetical protein